jgi:glycosyltransferase involved in cell wall biosynthesis
MNNSTPSSNEDPAREGQTVHPDRLPFQPVVCASANLVQLSVILPCYNGADTISVQLEALAAQIWSGVWELIVVDNRSTDDSVAVAERYRSRFRHFRIVHAVDQQSRPHALNVGCRAARGDAVAFCDADDEVAPGWVAAIGEALQQQDFVASRFEVEKLNPPWLQKVRPWGQRDRLPNIWYPPYLPYAGGCGMGIKRCIHERVGGFDEKLPHLQDADYCFKVQLQGVPLGFVPDALVHVRFRYSLWATFHQARNWAEYNVVLYKKYRGVSGAVMPRPWRRYARDWVRLFKSLPRATTKARFGACIWLIGWQCGRLAGCIECGVPPV